MSLGSHLRELRNRLLISMIGIVPAAVVGWVYYQPVVDVLVRPVCDLPGLRASGGTNCGPLTIIGILGPFSLQVKVALTVALILASPVWLYQLWAFVTPGLHKQERRWGLAFVAAGVPLFITGAGLSYLVLPTATKILLGFTPSGVGNLLPFDEYLDFVLRMILAFGLAFELPLLIIALNLVGVVSAARLKQWWRGIIFAIFVFAAVATPTGDPVTMSLLGVPMALLFGVAYLVCRRNDRRKASRSSEPDYEALDDDEISPLDEAPLDE